MQAFQILQPGSTGQESVCTDVLRSRNVFKKNLNASKPSEHPPQVEECLKVTRVHVVLVLSGEVMHTSLTLLSILNSQS